MDKSILNYMGQPERRVRKSAWAFLLSLLALMAQSTAFAVVVDDLFEVEIPVPDESTAMRRVALSDGLAEVLVRVSGDRDILQKLRPPSASAYVKQFRYTAIEVAEGAADAAGQPTNRYRLWVQYNGTRIMDLMREQAIPIWGEYRSQAVIWFAVNDGSKRYTLKESDFSLLKDEAAAAFKRRGIPVVWPKNDSQDRRELHFADIWAGFAGPLQKASARYSKGPVVSATMSWNGRVWVGDWSVFMDRESRRWSLRETDYDALISKGVDLVADAIGNKYAVLEVKDASKLQQILVEIDSVNTVEGFRQVQNYLMSLPVVQSVRLSQIESERVAFWLSLRSRVDDFLNLVNAGTEIVPDMSANAGLANDMQNFVYRFKKTR